MPPAVAMPRASECCVLFSCQCPPRPIPQRARNGPRSTEKVSRIAARQVTMHSVSLSTWHGVIRRHLTAALESSTDHRGVDHATLPLAVLHHRLLSCSRSSRERSAQRVLVSRAERARSPSVCFLRSDEITGDNMLCRRFGGRVAMRSAIDGARRKMQSAHGCLCPLVVGQTAVLIAWELLAASPSTDYMAKVVVRGVFTLVGKGVLPTVNYPNTEQDSITRRHPQLGVVLCSPCCGGPAVGS